MEENNLKMYDEEVITCKCDCSIVAKNDQGCKTMLKPIRASCKCIGCILGDFF